MPITQEILNGCRKGKRHYQEEAYKILYPKMAALAKRYVYNLCDAQEIFNTAMFKGFTKINSFKGDHTNFSAWIKRIVINEAIQFIRKRNYKREQFIEENQETAMISVKSENLQLVSENENYLYALLEHLDVKSKMVFNLFVIEGFSHIEIATALSITVSNSKWHLHKARKQLRELLQKNENWYETF